LQAAAIRRNADERGVENRTWSPEMLAVFQKTWQQVATREADRNPFFKEVWEQLEAFREDYREWGGRAFLPRRAVGKGAGMSRTP
jgi:TRAP-type mannitol/chloroaromatic compound transport system substrate-binding protein